MQELKDDDILEVNDSEVLSDDDIIEESDPTSLLQRLQSAITPSQETIDTAQGLGESALDFSKGVARGLTMEGLDELGGAIGAGVERGLGAIGIGPAAVDAQLREQGFTGSGVDQSLADTYRDYQSAISQDLKASEERSPILTTAGQIAGGVTGGTALSGAIGAGKAAKNAMSIADIARNSGKSKAALELLKRGGQSYKEIAPLLAVEAGLASEEKLVGEGSDAGAFAQDVAGGLAFGLPAMVGLQGITDATIPAGKSIINKAGKAIKEAAEESPIVREAKIAFEKYGKNAKISPLNEKARKEGVANLHGGTPLNILAEKQAETITNEVLNADKKLAKLVGDTLDASEKSGKILNNDFILNNISKNIDELKSQFPEIANDINFKKVIEDTKKKVERSVTPKQVKSTMQDITSQINKLKSYKNPSPQQQELTSVLSEIRNALDSNLKKEIPEYARAANRLFSYRRNFIEQPIGGSYNPDLNQMWYSDLKKGDLKLTQAYEDLVRSSQDASQSARKTGSRYSNLRKAAENFENEELMRMQKGEISTERIAPSVKDLFKNIDDYASENMMLDSVKRTQETQSSEGLLKKLIFLGAETGRGGIYQGAYMAGRASVSELGKKVSKTTKSTARIGRNLYNAPTEKLTELATLLEGSQVTQSLGKALREGLQSGDVQKRNAALFTIMQNPKSRMFIEDESNVEE